VNIEEKREMIFSGIDSLAEKVALDEDVRNSVWGLDTTISEITLRFEEGLRKHIPVTREVILEGEIVGAGGEEKA